MTPSWLPAMIETDGDWEKVLVRLYHLFEKDFHRDGCSFNEFPIIWDKRKIDSPYEEGFWHLISKVDNASGDRLIDFPRAKKLSWCKPCITNHQDTTIKVWDIREKGRIKVYIWLEKWDYVVILQKRRKVAFLVTAFHIFGDSTRKKLRKKFRQRIA